MAPSSQTKEPPRNSGRFTLEGGQRLAQRAVEDEVLGRQQLGLARLGQQSVEEAVRDFGVNEPPAQPREVPLIEAGVIQFDV
jgi:hypothetical protein